MWILLRLGPRRAKVEIHLVHLGLTKTLLRNGFLQIEATFHISDPEEKEDLFSKLKPANSMLLNTWKAYHNPAQL